MYEWNEAIQKMIDQIEKNIADSPSLLELSGQIGYSPCYCSVQFRRICGMTVKSYIAGRKLALAALSLRDTRKRIIDIAVECGFSSQEALTRAFRAAFGCTPAAYRKNPIPIPLPIYKTIYFPEHYHELYQGGNNMDSTILTEASVQTIYVPAHKYIGIWDENADCYGDFWKTHDCDEVCGIIDSLSNVSDLIITGHTAGWYYTDSGRRYFYGIGVSADYDGKIPDGFELKEFPGSYYLAFHHPPFDYLKDNAEVMSRVEKLAWNYDIEKAFPSGSYAWNEDICQCYQRHYPEGLGYEILRPFRRV